MFGVIIIGVIVSSEILFIDLENEMAENIDFPKGWIEVKVMKELLHPKDVRKQLRMKGTKSYWCEKSNE